MSTILVISDSHINPANENTAVDLWYRLGKYCTETKPELIVHLGDVADLSSQAWRVAARGPYTLEEECKSVVNVLTAFEEAIEEYNNVQRKMKKKLYRPQKFLTLGNHDVRNGVTVIEDIFDREGWCVVDYMQPLELRGINFCHCMAKGMTDQVCSTAQELLENWNSNIVVGHGHHKDFYEGYSLAAHKQITALKCPAFTLSHYDWAKQTEYKWSRGFTEIEPGRGFVWKDLTCLYENL